MIKQSMTDTEQYQLIDEEQGYGKYDISLYSLLPTIENPIYGSSSYEEVKNDFTNELEKKLESVTENHNRDINDLILSSLKMLNKEISELNESLENTFEFITTKS